MISLHSLSLCFLFFTFPLLNQLSKLWLTMEFLDWIVVHRIDDIYLMIENKLKLIGRGRNSEVFSYGSGSAHVVLKVVSSLHKKEQEHLKNQSYILASLSHPYIAKTLKYQQNVAFERNQNANQLKQTKNILVLEYATHGSLLKYIDKQDISIQCKRLLFRHVAQALSYLHAHAIAHRDIKLQNILVFLQNQEVVAKLSDFGLASHCKKADQLILFTDFKGTKKGYMAPEIHQAKHKQESAYDALKADVFALGVVLFALVFGNLPFEQARLQNKLYNLITEKRNDEFWTCHSQCEILAQTEGYLMFQFKTLFLKMVSANPSERPQVNDVLSSGWLYPFQ